MSAFYFDSAIAWAQFQLRGGWKSLFILTGVLSAITIFIITLAFQLSDTPAAKQSVLVGSLGFLLVAQGVILLFVASNMISSSIRNDLTTRLIESHRLMPLGGTQAVTGYLAAVGLRTGFISFCIFAIGLVLCQLSGHLIGAWIVGNLLLLIFGVVNWSIVALLSFTSPLSFVILIVLQLILFMGSINSPLLLAVPGMRMICGPLEGGVIFGLPGGDRMDTIAFSIALQLALAVICILAAARKYERDDQRGLPLWLTMGWMLIWVCASSYGIKSIPNNWTLGMFEEDPRVTAIGTTIFSLISGILIVSSLVWADINYVQKYFHASTAGEPAPRRNGRWVFPVCIILSVMLFTSLTWVEPDNAAAKISPYLKPKIAMGVAAICVITLLQAWVLMRIFYLRTRRANLFIAIVFGLLWLAPLIADSVYDNYKYPYENGPMNFFSLGSPLGWLSKADKVPMLNRACGILFQFGMLMFFIFVKQLFQLGRKLRSR